MSKQKQFWNLSSQKSLCKKLLITVPAATITCNIIAAIFSDNLREWGAIAVLAYTIWVVLPAYCVQVFVSIGAFREDSRSTFVVGNVFGLLALSVELLIMVAAL